MKSEFEESDERFEAIFQQAAVGIAQLSPEGTWIRTNQKFCEILGYSEDELKTMTFHQVSIAEIEEIKGETILVPD